MPYRRWFGSHIRHIEVRDEDGETRQLVTYDELHYWIRRALIGYLFLVFAVIFCFILFQEQRNTSRAQFRQALVAQCDSSNEAKKVVIGVLQNARNEVVNTPTSAGYPQAQKEATLAFYDKNIKQAEGALLDCDKLPTIVHTDPTRGGEVDDPPLPDYPPST
jgi:hypothetical protein